MGGNWRITRSLSIAVGAAMLASTVGVEIPDAVASSASTPVVVRGATTLPLNAFSSPSTVPAVKSDDGTTRSAKGLGTPAGGAEPQHPSGSATAMVTSPQGDSLVVTQAVVRPIDGPWVLCQSSTPVMWPGSGQVGVCGYIQLYDSVTGYYAPANNYQWDYIYDACGNPIESGSSFGWYETGTSPRQLSSGWVGGQPWAVPATEPLSCVGDWTEVYGFQQTFTDGVTLSATLTTTFRVYRSYADYIAQTQAQQTPTGGAVGDREQLGGCGSGHSTHAQSTKFPVDTATGNFWHTFDDLSIPGRGRPIDLTRTYNSLQAAIDGPFGYGWHDSYAASLDIQPSTVVVNQCNGSQSTFTLSGATWTAPPRVLATLVHNGDGTWTFTRGGRELYVFDAGGRLTAERDLNGYTTTISYPTPSTRVVSDPASRSLTFTFTGNRVTSVSDSSTPARRLSYGYDGAGNLTDVIDVGGGHWQFTYDGSHRMVTMRSPRFYGDTTTNPSPVVTNHYDTQGRVDWQSDQVGRITSFDYTSIPNSTKVTDPRGNTTVYQYQDGLLVFETRGYGTSSYQDWTYRYDPDTLGLMLIADPAGHTSRASYDTDGNMVTRTDGLYRQTVYTYNSLRQVTSVTDPQRVNGVAATRTFTYDAAGNLLSEAAPLLDANGVTVATATVTNHYDDPAQPGDLTSRTDSNGNTTTYTYDPFGDLTSTVAPPTPENPSGNKATFGYDTAKGWLTSAVSPRGNISGGNPAAYTTSYSYDAYGRLTVTKDPLWTATQPIKHRTVRHYDSDGNLDAVTDGNNHTTRYVYNAAGEQTEIQRADNSTVKTEYWPDGSVKSQIDAANQPTSYDYNPAGQLQTVTDPLNRTTSYSVDGVGNLVKMVDPSNRVTTMTYDAANQLKSITYSDGVTPNVTDITYDGNGQRTAMTDGTGTTTWHYDSLHRLTQHTDGTTQTVQYGYDIGSRLTAITYPGTTGTVTRTYDAADRLTTVQDWAGRMTTFSYDNDSNLVGQTYPNGTKATFTPDAANRVSGITHAPTATPNVPLLSFSYDRDGAGLLSSVTSTGVPSDNHTWTYDAINQLTGVDGTMYGYDAADNLSRRLDGTTQVHDAANQLNVASPAPISLVGTNSGGGSTSTSLTLALPTGTAAGDQILVAVTLPYGKTINTPTGYTPVGTYNSGTSNTSAKVAVYRRTAASGDASVTVPFQGKFDKAATLLVYRGVHPVNPIDTTSAGSAAPGTTVTVPSVNAALYGERLVWIGGASGTAGTWTAPAGMTSRVSRTSSSSDSAIADQTLAATGATGSRAATHDSNTQVVGVLVALRPAGSGYSYDPQGNRISMTDPAGTVIAHTYDQANRLTAYSTTATYRYNADGLRTSKTVAGTTTNVTWDLSSQKIPALISDGIASYIYGVNGQPLERIDSTGAVLYYHQDQLGSTRALTNDAGGVVQTYTYDPYGNVTGTSGTATNPLRFAGQYTDDESGYQYLRARYFDPASGEFLTRDPITELTGQPYAYGVGNPLANTDPTGLCPICVAALAGALIGGAIDLGSQALSNATKGCDLFHDINWGRTAVSAGIGGFTAGMGEWLVGARAVQQEVQEGIYIVRAAEGRYVGQSGNMAERLAQHVARGKFTEAEVSTAERIYVGGGKTAREIAEQLKIDELGGLRNLINERNPIGPRRFELMPPGYTR